MPVLYIIRRCGQVVFRTRRLHVARAFVRASNKALMGPCRVLVRFPDLVYPQVYPNPASDR